MTESTLKVTMDMGTLPATIITNYIYPPIPIRKFDWCAYYKDQEERQEYGYGATEQEAIDDLLSLDIEENENLKTRNICH